MSAADEKISDFGVRERAPPVRSRVRAEPRAKKHSSAIGGITIILLITRRISKTNAVERTRVDVRTLTLEIGEPFLYR